ncbi:MAG TPA: hypothetical protein VGQ21_22980 [Thermoanaerobaculia bacterium]|nr:hypothetical protein [Thermoanaerobaculia bacterium]
MSRYVSDMHREISDLETRLQTLRTHAGATTGAGTGASSGGGTSTGGGFGARRGRPPGRPPGSGVTAGGKRRGRPPGSKNVASSSASAAPSGAAAASAPPAGKRRRRARITPEQLASRQLQGRYLGLIRQIPANKRGQYQKIAKDSGREAAINAMKSAVSR